MMFGFPPVSRLSAFSSGNQFGVNPGGTGSEVGSADEKMRQLMEMLKRFNPHQATMGGVAGVVDAGTFGAGL
jgi:hypothetical protein